MLNIFKNKNVITDEMKELYHLRDVVKVLELQNVELEKRIVALEKVVFALKENVKDEKQIKAVSKAKKWLQGYPDESDKVE
jgi:hypothetical protein